MTTEEATPEAQPAGEPAVTTPAVAKTTETEPTEHMIPKSRFDEVNDKYKELVKAQEKAAKAQEEAERQRLEKQNEFQKLYQGAQEQVKALTPYKERFEAMLTQTKERNEERVKAIPKDKQGLVPEYDDPLKLASWLDTNEATLLAKPTAPSLNGGAGKGGQGGDAPSLDEIKEQAARLNVDWRHMAKQYGVAIPNS